NLNLPFGGRFPYRGGTFRLMVLKQFDFLCWPASYPRASHSSARGCVFRLAEQRQRPASAAHVCDHGYGAEPHPGRLSTPILIFRFPTAATPHAPAPSPPW